MTQSNVDFNQRILPQPDMESTIVNGTVVSGNNVKDGMPVKLTGDPAKFAIVTDDLQHYGLGIAIEDIDASAGDVAGKIMTGGGISLDTLDLSAITITATSVTSGMTGLMKNNNIRILNTADAIKKVVE